MNVLHVTPAFYPATYWGGPIYSVYALCNSLAKAPQVCLRVITTDSAGPNRRDSVEVMSFPVRYNEAYDVFFFRRRFGASFSPAMLSSLWPMIAWSDVVHLTAVYSPPTIPTLIICGLLKKPLVWSPRGAFQTWPGMTLTNLKRAWDWICNVLLRHNRSVLHVTSPEEAAESSARIPRSDIALIPNGVDIPRALPSRKWMPNGCLRLVYLGRLHPKKGIENLLRALYELQDPTVSLAIYGGSELPYIESLHRVIVELGLQDQVGLRGHVEYDEKGQVFLEADICVVPSFTENFGLVVAESLAHGVPVIASTGTPWKEVVQRKCGLWVDNSPEKLAVAIQSMRSMALQEMGERGRRWMAETYEWNSIASSMLSVYGRLVGKEHYRPV